ncbi:MbtH protein [Kitasatospora sp. MAA4]|uniref:MbtH family protein n=1 Tax=Kitasatospora sp. MAA4 TaxID=3035093 RepID=UPI002475FE5E|nr:MbtH family NRPS accessory protein [Kitasatospora sp. MAA4]MDH6133737.1 MbtH protein [Kitasatospora sp. MAA4]
MFENDGDRQYDVVRNAEDQYSLWPTGRTLAPGWEREGSTGSTAECLARIEVLWTDLRPLSVRERAAR